MKLNGILKVTIKKLILARDILCLKQKNVYKESIKPTGCPLLFVS